LKLGFTDTVKIIFLYCDCGCDRNCECYFNLL